MTTPNTPQTNITVEHADKVVVAGSMSGDVAMAPNSNPPGVPNAQAPEPLRAWTVPYRRNPFFTGREDEILKVRGALLANGSAAVTQPQAMTGLGGVGKTQTAVEYAYRFKDEYASVFWISATTESELAQGFILAAKNIGVANADVNNEMAVIANVHAWLNKNSRWLMIFDNVEKMATVEKFLPAVGHGHVLLTTRAAWTGHVAAGIKVDSMAETDGALLLLRRAKLLHATDSLSAANEPDRITAGDISRELGGLPLALDQAGAYIEEGCGLSEYLDLYHRQGDKLRNARGDIAFDHPSVTVTFSLAFDQVKRSSPNAANLIEQCAFFAADSILEGFFQDNDCFPSDGVERVDTFREACRFSLIERNQADGTLHIHRLVQEVTKDILSTERKADLAATALAAVERIFPEYEYTNLQLCRQLMPHALVCVDHISRYSITTTDAANLFAHLAGYLAERRALDAEKFAREAVHIAKTNNVDAPTLARCLNNLGRILSYSEKFDEAESTLEHAVRVRKEALGPEHRDLAVSLHNLATVYKGRKRIAKAEKAYKQSISILRKSGGSNEYLLGRANTNLGTLYAMAGDKRKAQNHLTEGMEISVRLLGRKHVDTVWSLTQLAALHAAEKNFDRARQLCEEAASIIDEIGEDEHSNITFFYSTYLDVLRKSGQTVKAIEVEHELRDHLVRTGSKAHLKLPKRGRPILPS